MCPSICSRLNLAQQRLTARSLLTSKADHLPTAGLVVAMHAYDAQQFKWAERPVSGQIYLHTERDA